MNHKDLFFFFRHFLCFSRDNLLSGDKMQKEKLWALTLILLIIMFSSLNKENPKVEELEVANTRLTFQIDNLTSKIDVYQDKEISSDYLVLDNSLPKERILSIDGKDSKNLPYTLVKNYESTDYLKNIQTSFMIVNFIRYLQ